MKKHLLFLGAPGAGKGTQAQLISQNNSYLQANFFISLISLLTSLSDMKAD